MSSKPTSVKSYKTIKTTPQPTARPETDLEDNLLALALINNDARQLVADAPIEIFTGDAQKSIVNHLKVNGDDLQNLPEYAKILSLRADARYAGWNDQDRYHEAVRLIRRIKDEYKKQQKNLLTSALRDAEEIGDEPRMRELLKQIQALNKEIYS